MERKYPDTTVPLYSPQHWHIDREPALSSYLMLGADIMKERLRSIQTENQKLKDTLQKLRTAQPRTKAPESWKGKGEIFQTDGGLSKHLRESRPYVRYGRHHDVLDADTESRRYGHHDVLDTDTRPFVRYGPHDVFDAATAETMHIDSRTPLEEAVMPDDVSGLVTTRSEWFKPQHTKNTGDEHNEINLSEEPMMQSQMHGLLDGIEKGSDTNRTLEHHRTNPPQTPAMTLPEPPLQDPQVSISLRKVHFRRDRIPSRQCRRYHGQNLWTFMYRW